MSGEESLSVFMQQPVGSRHPFSPAPKQCGGGERRSALFVAWRRVQECSAGWTGQSLGTDLALSPADSLCEV